MNSSIQNKYINKEIIKMNTIIDVIRFTISQFNSSKIYYGHGTDNPLDEAIHLVLSSLFLPLDIPLNIYNAILTLKEKKIIAKHINNRINKRIPVPYLTNISWFCGFKFYVDNRVLIPRSPIGELIINRFNNLITYEPKRILDMCTGSGCIAIACAHIYPKAEIDAVDINKHALKVAEYNIQIHNVEDRVTPIFSNLFCNLIKLTYDIIIINPPYVKKNEIKNLPLEFKQEPISALSNGNNPFKLIRKILINSHNFLNKNGILICEVGDNMDFLIKKYPKVPFQWINFVNGGYGVFMITKKQLIKFKNIF